MVKLINKAKNVVSPEVRAMPLKKLQNRFVGALVLLVFSSLLFIGSTVAWLTQLLSEDVTVEIGQVVVDIDVFFYDDGTSVRTEAQEVVIDDMGTPETTDDVTKPGVYLVNITENTSTHFFDDFRVHIEIYSSVNTYFRVRIIEQLTLTYVNYLGVVTELSVINNEYMPFNYTTTNWYDNRSIDGYMYYQLPVQRVSESVPLQLDLIGSAPVGGFSTYSPGYSLQIAFSIEAVQASGGPENVWELSTPPWGSSW